jgi:hypothetical protein
MATVSWKSPYEIRGGKWAQALTDGEGYMLWALMRTPVLSLEDLAREVWGPPHRWPEFWQSGIGVRLTNLRRKLRRFGWTVHCHGNGQGSVKAYRLQRYDGVGVLAA